jgi:hypothetical protein
MIIPDCRVLKLRKMAQSSPSKVSLQVICSLSRIKLEIDTVMKITKTISIEIPIHLRAVFIFEMSSTFMTKLHAIKN